MIRGNKVLVEGGKGEKNDPHLLRCHFGVTNMERENRLSLSARAELSTHGICDQRAMTNEGV